MKENTKNCILNEVHVPLAKFDLHIVHILAPFQRTGFFTNDKNLKSKHNPQYVPLYPYTTCGWTTVSFCYQICKLLDVDNTVSLKCISEELMKNTKNFVREDGDYLCENLLKSGKTERGEDLNTFQKIMNEYTGIGDIIEGNIGSEEFKTILGSRKVNPVHLRNIVISDGNYKFSNFGHGDMKTKKVRYFRCKDETFEKKQLVLGDEMKLGVVEEMFTLLLDGKIPFFMFIFPDRFPSPDHWLLLTVRKISETLEGEEIKKDEKKFPRLQMIITESMNGRTFIRGEMKKYFDLSENTTISWILKHFKKRKKEIKDEKLQEIPENVFIPSGTPSPGFLKYDEFTSSKNQ